MEKQEELVEVQRKLKRTNQELDVMEPISKYENEEEDIDWIFKKSGRSNEGLWSHYGGRKAKQYFINLEQDEREYRKRMQNAFMDKYDEMEKKRSVLIRESEELSEKCIKIKWEMEKSQGESEKGK